LKSITLHFKHNWTFSNSHRGKQMKW
jgi:hypothetical protein